MRSEKREIKVTYYTKRVHEQNLGFVTNANTELSIDDETGENVKKLSEC